MKSKFKKLVILTHKRDKRQLVANLQQLGVLHLEKNIAADNKRIEELQQSRDTLYAVIDLLVDNRKNSKVEQFENVDLNEIIKEIRQINKNAEGIKQKIESIEKEKEKLSKWGEFNHENFKPLQEKGLNVYLAAVNKKEYNELNLADYFYQVINRDDKRVYLAFFSKSSKLNLPIDYFRLADKSPKSLNKKIKQNQKKLEELNQSLTNYHKFLPLLREALIDTEDELELLEADHSFFEHAEGELISLSGWFPEEKVDEVTKFLNEKNITHFIRKPKASEDVPVRLKNPKYAKLYEPITNIFELPNYFETDLTPFIAVFYPILFAYCLGDAGYGFVLTIMMLAGIFTFFKEQKRVAILGIILGLVTTVMGLVKSGSLFGIMLVSDHEQPWIRFLSQYVFIPDDSEYIFNAFNVALMIGVVQILTGIIISIYTRAKYEGRLHALNPLGKLCIVLGLLWIFMADMQNSDWFQAEAVYRYGLLITGLVLVMLFHELSEPLGKRLATSVMPLFFIFTGLLGDILSYVRLFALGLASSVLGLVVNQIGQQIMDGGIVAIIGGILFLIFGHALNFGIAALGSFVHPLRLTFVEFYGNAAFKGKGKPYKPYQKSFKTHIT